MLVFQGAHHRLGAFPTRIRLDAEQVVRHVSVCILDHPLSPATLKGGLGHQHRRAQPQLVRRLLGQRHQPVDELFRAVKHLGAAIQGRRPLAAAHGRHGAVGASWHGQRTLGPIQLTLHFVISKIFANFGGSNQIVGGTGGLIGLVDPLGTLGQLEYPAILMGEGLLGRELPGHHLGNAQPPLARHVGNPLLVQHPFIELGVAAVHRVALGEHRVGLAHPLEQGLGEDGFELAGGRHQGPLLPLLAQAHLAQFVQVLDVLHHANIDTALGVELCHNLPLCRPWQPLAAHEITE